MTREDTLKAVDESLLVLMEFTRETRKPIKNIHIRDLQILLYIDQKHDNHRVTVSELAYHLNITPAAASQILTGYEKKGWIRRIRSEQDRRTVYIEMTDAMKNHFYDELQIHRERLNKLLDKIGEKDCEALVRILSILNDYVRETYI